MINFKFLLHNYMILIKIETHFDNKIYIVIKVLLSDYYSKPF